MYAVSGVDTDGMRWFSLQLTEHKLRARNYQCNAVTQVTENCADTNDRPTGNCDNTSGTFDGNANSEMLASCADDVDSSDDIITMRILCQLC